MVLDCLLALPRCGVASGSSKFSSKWLNKKFVQFSSPASSLWWTVRSVRFRARRLSDSVQFVQFSSWTVPALIVTLTLAGTRYYNILDSTRGVDVTPSSLAPDRAKAPVKKQRVACYGTKLMIPEFKVLRQLLRSDWSLWGQIYDPKMTFPRLTEVIRGHLPVMKSYVIFRAFVTLEMRRFRLWNSFFIHICRKIGILVNPQNDNLKNIRF